MGVLRYNVMRYNYIRITIEVIDHVVPKGHRKKLQLLRPLRHNNGLFRCDLLQKGHGFQRRQLQTV